MPKSNLKSPPLDNTKAAIVVVVLGAIAFSFGDAVVKFVSVDFVLWQILVLRAAISIPALIGICWLRSDPISIAPKNFRWTMIRSMLMILMWLTYYAALLILPVSMAASVYYTMPIFVTLLAAVFVGDKITAGGWIGVILGFVGVLLIIKPDSNEFNAYTLLPLVSAVFFAFAMIITRIKIRDEHPYVLTINLQAGFLLVGVFATAIIYSFGGLEGTEVEAFFGGTWKSLGGWGLAVIVVLAIAITAGNIATSIAYQIGKSSIVATFSFSYIPFVTLWGFLMFGEYPDLITLIGIVLIIVAGIFAVRK